MKSRLLLILLFIPLASFAQQEEISVPGQNLFVNKIAAQQNLYPHLNGTGIAVSIKEFRFDSTDVDFRGRVLASPNAAANLTSHADFMATLVGGAANADLRGRGAAPGCWLASSSFVGLMPDTDYAAQNISVQNHSYGVDIQNWYGEGAVAYDKTTEQIPTLLHVFSAGNKGDSASLSGTYAGISSFANLTGNFKMAKNVLLVGAVDSFAQVAPRSSRGPAYDGRTKPDLVAFGQDGSSGAAALVSGAAAVAQQAFLLVTDTLPSSDLVRAVLLNSATDLGTPGPDFESGFGNLDLKNAVQTILNQRFADEKILPGQVLAFPLVIPPNTRQVKITLAWNDPSVSALSPKALLHDLDLSLLDPLGNEHLPWVLNPWPHADSLRNPARRGRDTLNNIEQATLDFPAAGVWEIRISTPAVLSGEQGFALAWAMDTLRHFEWVYPFSNAPVPGGEDLVLRWESNFPDAVARLEWRPVSASDWQLADDSLDLQRGWKRWTFPDTFTEAQMRVTIGNDAFYSDTFLISKELQIKIGFNCLDSAMIFWNPASPNAAYQPYALGEKFLEPITATSDTFFIFQKSAFPQQRFAVAPFAQAGHTLGTRSPAPDISQQGVECYFKGFIASLNPDAAIDLNLQIGTSYGLAKVFFEKIIAGAFVTISEQIAVGEHYTFTDANPRVGENTYRARLLLANGQTLTSDPARVYVAGTSGWAIFPNPVPQNGILHAVTNTDDIAELMLFDALGRLVLHQTLDDFHVEVSLAELPHGVYFFKVNDGEKFVGGGKLILR